MQILLLSPRQCWPPVSGAKLREFYLARALGENASLTHISFNEPGQSAPSGSDLPFCDQILSLPRPALYTPGKIVRGLLGRWPLPVVNYQSTDMMSLIQDVTARNRFDIIHFESIHMAAYAPALRKHTDALFVYDWHNIESELMFRYGANTPSIVRKLYARLTGARLSGLERQILRDGSAHVVCSAREQINLHQISPTARLAIVENGVDAQSFTAVDNHAGDPHRIIFVGSMNYHANIEAARYFVHKVWPDLRSGHPHWRLTLVGSSPAPGVLELQHQAGVEVTGTVPDVRPYYENALASVVPLQTGGGTRLKILEAMAAGVPVISTAIGAEGLAVTSGENILISDSDSAWATHLASLADSPDLRARLAGNGRELIRTRYDWQVLGQALYQVYVSWLNSTQA